MSEIESFTEIVMAVSAIAVPIVIVWYYLRSKREIRQEQAAKADAQEINVDPVCGMTVDPDKATGSFDYKDKTYYFCSAHCLQEFRDDPERFINLST